MNIEKTKTIVKTLIRSKEFKNFSQEHKKIDIVSFLVNFKKDTNTKNDSIVFYENFVKKTEKKYSLIIKEFKNYKKNSKKIKKKLNKTKNNDNRSWFDKYLCFKNNQLITPESINEIEKISKVNDEKIRFFLQGLELLKLDIIEKIQVFEKDFELLDTTISDITKINIVKTRIKQSELLLEGLIIDQYLQSNKSIKKEPRAQGKPFLVIYEEELRKWLDEIFTYITNEIIEKIKEKCKENSVISELFEYDYKLLGDIIKTLWKDIIRNKKFFKKYNNIKIYFTNPYIDNNNSICVDNISDEEARYEINPDSDEDQDNINIQFDSVRMTTKIEIEEYLKVLKSLLSKINNFISTNHTYES